MFLFSLFMIVLRCSWAEMLQGSFERISEVDMFNVLVQNWNWILFYLVVLVFVLLIVWRAYRYFILNPKTVLLAFSGNKEARLSVPQIQRMLERDGAYLKRRQIHRACRLLIAKELLKKDGHEPKFSRDGVTHKLYVYKLL